MCEQLGQEPEPDKIPPEFEDFPTDVQEALIVFGKLGDKIVADVGYMGKDYTALPIYMAELHLNSKEIFLDTLLRLDEKAIKQSSEQMERARQKAKSKT